jgi:large subunit ribosomal protein L25
METVLKAQTRDGRGKGDARKLRAQGMVPGVLYGHGVEPVAISLSSKDLLHFFHANHGAATVVDLEVDGKKHMAIPREIQQDHLHGRYVHIDFLAVRRDEKVKMSVEIHEVGEAPGVKTGGVIEHHLRDVEIECLPGDVPEQITADVGSLELGDMLRLGDIPAPSGVTFLTDPETPVISVVTPAALRTEADLLLPGEEAPEAAAEGVEEPAAEGEGGAEAGEEPAPEAES